MKFSTLLLSSFAVTSLALPIESIADWGEVGVAYKCDRSKGTFMLFGTEESSSPESSILTPPDYELLLYGDHRIKCRLRNRKISGSISVTSPRPSPGMGAGSVKFSDIHVGKNTAAFGDIFNNGMETKRFIRLEIELEQKSLKVTKCYGERLDDNYYHNVQCETETSPLLPLSKNGD
jgi:hypothetical protein